MAPTTFDQWFEIRKVKDPSFKELAEQNPKLREIIESAWEDSRADFERKITTLENKVEDLETELEEQSCPYDYCMASDCEELESDLDEARAKLRKCDKMLEHLKKARDEFRDVKNSLDDAIENTDYQLIVDSVSKDFENAYDYLNDTVSGFETIDI